MSRSAEHRLFSVDEAESLLPALELRFGHIVQLRTSLRTTYEELDKLGEELDVKTFDNPHVGKTPEAVQLRGRFRILMEQLTEELGAVEELGVAVKDLDLGLCDFLGRVNGREVWLCWQYGEKSIAFYHELDAGFSGRRPLPRELRPEDATPHKVVH